jgi:hypothetical protein
MLLVPLQCGDGDLLIFPRPIYHPIEETFSQSERPISSSTPASMEPGSSPLNEIVPASGWHVRCLSVVTKLAQA